MPASGRSAREMAVIEANALALGASLDGLMENAGRAVAEEVARHLPSPPARVAVVAGAGNNGGDGSCAAFYLAQWGFSPELWLIRPASEVRSAPARRCLERVSRRGGLHLGIPTVHELNGFALVIDALLGTGHEGELRPPYNEAAAVLNSLSVPVLSIDVPSGLGSAGAVRPRWTVTFTAPKKGVEAETAGEVTLREIGIPPAALTETGPGEFHFFPPVAPTGRAGRVIIVGGGPYAGAPALAALAALRAGAERATVLCPSSVAREVQGFSPSLVVRSVGSDRLGSGDAPALAQLLSAERHDALAIGMGAGREGGTQSALRELLAGAGAAVPCVADADALEAALAAPRKSGSPPLILTPNAGEFLRMTRLSGTPSEEQRLGAARELVASGGFVLLAKGDPDLIVEKDRQFLNRHHHPAATVAGAGDVLSGVVGALLAQGLEGLSAARLAAYWVGDAGLRVAERRGAGLTAPDLIEELPASLVEGIRRLRG